MADKLDLVFKKVVNRQYTSAAKKWYEENPGVPFKLKGSDVWIDNIPETPPPADSAVIKGWRVANKLVMTHDSTVNNNQSWYADDAGTKLEGFVSPRYGQDYTARLFIQGGAEVPTTHSSGWFFDYESGILTFDGNPPGSAFEVMCYQYIGATADDLAAALEGSAWQDPVINFVDEPRGGEVGKERYIVSMTPIGGSVFEGHAGDIAEFDGVTWQFTAVTQGKVTYAFELDRLYVYDNNDGWAWSGIDSADLDYDNSDSGLNALSIKAAIDELDALARQESTVIWVDSNRLDMYAETGSDDKPFKTLAAAATSSDPADTIRLNPGTYDGAGILFDDNVSLLGESATNTVINNDMTFGTDTTGDVRITIGGVTFGAASNVVVNNAVDIKDVKTDGSLTFNSDCVGYDVDINTSVPRSALIVNGNKTVFDLLTTTQSADQLALEHNAGKLIIATAKVAAARAAAPAAVSVGGSFEAGFTSIVNTGGGLALNIDNGAIISDSNALVDVMHTGGIECNDAVTRVEGVTGGNPTSTVTDDANLIYRGGTQLKNDSTIIKTESGGILVGKTMNDSIDRVAQVAQYDATHGFLLLEPCIDDIDIP